MRYSLDGTTWIDISKPDTIVPVYTSVTYGNGTFIAISSNNYIATSTDGLYFTYSYYVGSMISMIYGIPSSGPFMNQSVFVMATSATTGTKIASANFIDTNVSNSIAIGNGAIASGNNSTAIGNGAIASGNNSTAIGNGAISTIDNIVVIGNVNNTINVPGKPFFCGSITITNINANKRIIIPVVTNTNSMNITFIGNSSFGGLALPYQAYGQYFVYMQLNLDGTSPTNGQTVTLTIQPSTDSANVDIGGYKSSQNYSPTTFTGNDSFSITGIHTYSSKNQLQYLYFFVGLDNVTSTFSEDGQWSYINVIQI
jgi:hypothetical protein